MSYFHVITTCLPPVLMNTVIITQAPAAIFSYIVIYFIVSDLILFYLILYLNAQRTDSQTHQTLREWLIAWGWYMYYDDVWHSMTWGLFNYILVNLYLKLQLMTDRPCILLKLYLEKVELWLMGSLWQMIAELCNCQGHWSAVMKRWSSHWIWQIVSCVLILLQSSIKQIAIFLNLFW